MNVRHNGDTTRVMREACPAARVAAAVPSGTLTIRDVAVDIDGRPVILAGDAWSIARVADATAVSAEPAAISYATTDAFADQRDGVDWATLTGGGARDLASDLADYAAEHGLYERSATADANGTVRFNALPAGMYLLARTHATQDDESCETTPMLVGVPIAEDGSIVYDVTVEPKYECPDAQARAGQARNRRRRARRAG